MKSRYKEEKPSWALPISLTILGIGLVVLLILVAPWIGNYVFANLSDSQATVIGAFIGAFSGILGVGISGIIGLTIVRRDRFEAEASECRALCAALGAELCDISGIFGVWSRIFEQQESKEVDGKIIIDTTKLPRFCTHVYEASCDRLGLLGPELSRQIVLLYGRTMVWAVYYEREFDRERLKWSVYRLRTLSEMTQKLSDCLFAEAGITVNSDEGQSNKFV